MPSVRLRVVVVNPSEDPVPLREGDVEGVDSSYLSEQFLNQFWVVLLLEFELSVLLIEK